MPVTPQQTIVDTSADPSLNYIRNRDINNLISGGGSRSTSTDREVINNVVENVTQRVTKVVETNVLADWNATSGTGLILNKPNNLATTTYVDNAIANVSGGGGNGNGIVDGTLTFAGGVITGPEYGVGLGMFGADPTSNTTGGDIYLQGGFDLSESGGPTTRGGMVNISAGQGANDVDASHGGTVEIYAGPASRYGGDIRIEAGGTYGTSGEAGDILIQSGSSASGYGGNVTIQSGVGTEGMQIFEGAVKMRGANVELISSFESLKIKTGDVDSLDGGPLVWEFNNTGVLTLPLGGDIVDSTGSSIIPGPGEIPPGQTGEIIFDGTSIYNTAQTSDIDVYTSGENYSEVWLRDADGVYITVMSPAAGPLQWRFGNDGKLFTDTSDIQVSGNLYLYTLGNDDIGSGAAQIDVTSDGVNIWSDWQGTPGAGTMWQFKQDGKLQLPAGGDIVDSNGQTVLGAGSGGGGGLTSRITANATTSSLANNATGNLTISGASAYMLMKIETSAAAWVRIYTSSVARTADATRDILTDPAPGSGVLGEFITTANQTVIVTPAVLGFVDTNPVSSDIQLAVTNKSGSTASITVTLTLLQLEA